MGLSFSKKLKRFFLFGLFGVMKLSGSLLFLLPCLAPLLLVFFFVWLRFVFPFFNPGILVVYWLFIGWYKKLSHFCLLEDLLCGPSLVVCLIFPPLSLRDALFLKCLGNCRR